MFIKGIVLSTLTAASIICCAGNAAVNTDFKLLKSPTVAQSWSNIGIKNITFSAKDGVKPEIGFACFTVTEGKESGSIRQNIRKSVVKGKKYTLSAAIKGVNFTGGSAGLVIIDKGWKNSVGIRPLKIKNNQWTTVKSTVIAAENWQDVVLVFYINNMTPGKLMVSDIKLEEVK